MIVVPYVAGKLRREVVAAVHGSGHPYQFYSLPADDPYAYADLIRRRWGLQGDLVIVEHDTVPPQGALERLVKCRHRWCTHPHDVHGNLMTDALALVKFSAALRYHHREVATLALAKHDGRAWTRQGLTNIAADCSEATLERDGRRACLRPDVQLPTDAYGEPVWPSTETWSTCDTAIARQLRAEGCSPHVHYPQTIHLHAY